MKLGLGTVQFGLDYGISNAGGKTPAEEVAIILDVAKRQGIRMIDTAASYGTSEQVLGKTLPIGHSFDIITKTPHFDSARIDRAHKLLLERSLLRSLRNMGLSAVYGLLIHDASDLLAEGGHFLFSRLLELKERGLVKKIGVSVYTAEQIERILEKYRFDIIQLPVNVLDQRLLLGGQLARLKQEGIEIHSRSAFLQGLLVMDPELLTPHFDTVKRVLRRYHETLRIQGITPVRAALGFLMKIPYIDVVICGVNDHRQLEELCASTGPVGPMDFTSFAIDDDSIVNPSRWIL